MRRAAVLVLLAAAVAAGEQRGGFVRIPAGRNGALVIEGEFWMGRTEVTVGEFGEFVRKTGHRTVAEKAGAERTWRSPGFPV